jgi:hypothetical protein
MWLQYSKLFYQMLQEILWNDTSSIQEEAREVREARNLFFSNLIVNTTFCSYIYKVLIMTEYENCFS